MPVVNIDMLEGKTREQKKTLIEKVTRAVCESVGCGPEVVTIVIRDISPESWGKEGKPKG
jgi:4-oxalocrotonate tautomerase